jgi:hypothetical protein
MTGGDSMHFGGNHSQLSDRIDAQSSSRVAPDFINTVYAAVGQLRKPEISRHEHTRAILTMLDIPTKFNWLVQEKDHDE